MVMTRERVQELIGQGLTLEQIAAQVARLTEPTPADAHMELKRVWTMADLDGYRAASEGKRRWA